MVGPTSTSTVMHTCKPYYQVVQVYEIYIYTSDRPEHGDVNEPARHIFLMFSSSSIDISLWYLLNAKTKRALTSLVVPVTQELTLHRVTIFKPHGIPLHLPSPVVRAVSINGNELLHCPHKACPLESVSLKISIKL